MNDLPHHQIDADEIALHWGLSFARGYLELGMLEKAERELSRLSETHREHPDVMSLRSHVLVARHRWPQVIEHARHAVSLFPDAPEYYIHAATALDMLGLPDEAHRVWQSAPEAVRSSGFFHLHVARFEAKLGNVVSARKHLARAIHLDPRLRSVAGRDPNLAEVLNQLSRN